MGMRTTIYGYIEEMEFWKEPICGFVRAHNKETIAQLTICDSWPPLSKEMFSITENTANNGPDLEYRGRIIHFGANLKGVEYDWAEWRAKFESLLCELFFLEAHVHFNTEYSLLETSSWRIDLHKYKVNHDGTIPVRIKSSDWDYESTYDQPR